MIIVEAILVQELCFDISNLYDLCADTSELFISLNDPEKQYFYPFLIKNFMKKLAYIFIILTIFNNCNENSVKNTTSLKSNYLDYSKKRRYTWWRSKKWFLSKLVLENFNVWTKKNWEQSYNESIITSWRSRFHEYLEAFDSYFPNAEIEYYYYDQLESYYSDQPNDSTLWTVERYVDEAEQVRTACRS